MTLFDKTILNRFVLLPLQPQVDASIQARKTLDSNIKRRDDLSVIAESAGLGNITRTSHDKSLTHTYEYVNVFKKKLSTFRIIFAKIVDIYILL